MRIIRHAILCFVPILLLGGCQPSAMRPEAVKAPTIANHKHLARHSNLPKPAEKPSIDVEQNLKNEVAQHEDYADIWNVIKAGLEFELDNDKPRVKDKIAWFAKNQAYIDRVVERAEPYLFYIISKLKERDMPLDLALLPIVESAYQPFATSPSHASGIWQFIPATGKRFGLKQNWWYDGRRDIVAATDAALDYLDMLHKRFNGNWFHALAAYNSGEGNIERAIRKNKKKGKGTDFWSLRLPRETRNYVPSLLAIAEILKHSEKYNITFKKIKNTPYFEKVDIGNQIDLSTVSTLSGLSIDEVYTLNPGFNRWATAPDGPHHILVPIAIAPSFKQKIAALPKSEHIQWKKYIIRKGDSLNLIAKRYLTSVFALKKANRLKGNMIRAGHTLLIPTAKQSAKYYSLSADARKFKGLKTTDDGKRYIYSVKRGDNLWDIGRYYGISVGQLTRWNGISKKSLLRPGQKLIVWVKVEKNKAEEVSFIKTAAKMTALDENAYIVQQGDSLWLIARKFDIKVNDLLKWNTLEKGKYLQPGQRLIVQQRITGV